MQEILLNDKEELTSPPQQGLNLRSLLRTSKRKAILMACITGMATAGVWYWNANSPPIYAGNFQILVEPVTSEAKLAEPTTLTRTQGVPNERLLEVDYSTVLIILTSPRMLSNIVEQVQTKYPNFNVESFRKDLKVERLGSDNRFDQSKIIQVSYQGANPQLVQLVLEETAQKYLEYSLDERKTRIGEGVKFIEEQLPKLRERVTNLQAELQKLQEQHELINPAVKGEALLEQLRGIKNQQLETQGQLQELRTLKENLQRQLGLTTDEAIAASTLSEDPNYQRLLGEFKAVESEIAVESVRFTPSSPNMQALLDKRNKLLDLLDRETQRILGRNLTAKADQFPVLNFQNSILLGMIRQLAETTNQIEVLEVRQQALTINQNEFEQQARQIPKVARRYAQLQQELAIASRTLEQLLTQRDTLRVEAAQSQIPWEIVSQPQIVRDAAGNPMPVPVDSKKKLLMGLMGGLLLAIVAAVFIEKSRDIFYSSEDLKDAAKFPFLGEIPSCDPLEKNLDAVSFLRGLIATEDNRSANSAFLDAFDALYANIRFRFSDPPIRSLAVSSAARGDGKSTIALYLAQTIAAIGQRVLLVDANLRFPQLHNSLGLPNQQGLSEILSCQISPNELIQRSPIRDNLFVLTAGQPSPDSIKLVGSAQMEKLMAEFEATFDLVIYDTSPLLDFTDTSFLSVHTDGILMVVRVNQTKKSLVMQTLDQIKSFNLPILGIIANHSTSISSGNSADLYELES